MTGAAVAAAIRNHEKIAKPKRRPKRPCVVCGRGCPYTVVDVCSPRCDAIHRGLEPAQAKDEPGSSPNSVERPVLCHWCGSAEPYIEGDDVHPGYHGPPCCPECKGT